MQKIIVTADDYGMCSEVDCAIEAGIENGFISTTNVLLNMETFSDSWNLRLRYPNLSIGIHWNVTTGKSISNPKTIPSLVDQNGVFWPIQTFKEKYRRGEISPNDLEKELEAQYAMFEKNCGRPDYWNTHENSSLEIKAYPIFEKVAIRHGIPATRTFQRVYYDKVHLGFRRAFREFAVKSFFELWFREIRKTFKMPTARVVSFDKISKTEGNVLLNALKNDGRNFIEVVFHPATTSCSPYFGNISMERLKEYKFVSSPEVRLKYESAGLTFVGFREIP